MWNSLEQGSVIRIFSSRLRFQCHSFFTPTGLLSELDNFPLRIGLSLVLLQCVPRLLFAVCIRIRKTRRSNSINSIETVFTMIFTFRIFYHHHFVNNPSLNFRFVLFFSLLDCSLSLSHTHTHTHTHIQLLCPPAPLALSFFPTFIVLIRYSYPISGSITHCTHQSSSFFFFSFHPCTLFSSNWSLKRKISFVIAGVLVGVTESISVLNVIYISFESDLEISEIRIRFFVGIVFFFELLTHILSTCFFGICVNLIRSWPFFRAWNCSLNDTHFVRVIFLMGISERH